MAIKQIVARNLKRIEGQRPAPETLAMEAIETGVL